MSGSSQSDRVDPEKKFKKQTVMLAGAWDLWDEISYFKKKKWKKKEEEEEELPPTHSVFLVSIKFFSPILTDPPVIILIWVFPVEKYPVCEKPQWLCYEGHYFHLGTKLAWAELPPPGEFLLPTHVQPCPCLWQGTPPAWHSVLALSPGWLEIGRASCRERV